MVHHMLRKHSAAHIMKDSECIENSCSKASTRERHKNIGAHRNMKHTFFSRVSSGVQRNYLNTCEGSFVFALFYRDQVIHYSHVRNGSAVIMKIGYGYTMDKDSDYFVSLAEESMRVGSLAATPGKWLVDSFPIRVLQQSSYPEICLTYSTVLVRLIPDWFPGAGFKRQAKEWGSQLYMQSLQPHNYVKRELVSQYVIIEISLKCSANVIQTAGTACLSFTSQLLSPEEGPPPDAHMEDIILWTAGALYAGGADTVDESFLRCMSYH